MTPEEFKKLKIGANMEVTLKSGETHRLTGVDWSINQVEIELTGAWRWVHINEIESIEDKE